MDIQKIVDGNTVTMVLKGWLDTQSAPDVEEVLDEIGSEITSIVLDKVRNRTLL